LVQKARRRLAGAATEGPGQPSVDQWNDEYRSGDWEYLGSISEIAHYMVVAGYVSYSGAAPNILDVGCGSGRLFQLLERFGFESYLGIDFSSEAIAAANSLATEAARFEIADFLTWEPSRSFDAVIFNESLYYAPDPEELLRRGLRWLSPGGFVIVSMYRHGGVSRIWSSIDANPEIEVVEATTMQNAQRLEWDVKALRPVAAPSMSETR
jgi:2-polyprenyl-6-hydroxyphenyl methylase/3-demethylubiquinone-9 3-methyltransferase